MYKRQGNDRPSPASRSGATRLLTSTGIAAPCHRAPSVRLPEIVIPSASVTASLQSPIGTLLVLWPESFRGGCSFGTGFTRVLPTRSRSDNGDPDCLASLKCRTGTDFCRLQLCAANGAAKRPLLFSYRGAIARSKRGRSMATGRQWQLSLIHI